MPCLVSCIALFTPRLALVLLWLFSDWLGRAYETTLWPLLGFFFMPYTTLAWAWAWHHGGNGAVEGWPWAVVTIAALVDLGVIGGSNTKKNRKAARRLARRED